VFQDYVKYAFSVRENIAIGNINGLEDQNEIELALKKAGLTNVVDKLPNKYETYISKMYDMSGIPDLSVGEWQKMSIARAFFRQASVYILDEPTASLDPKAEHEMFEQFVKICEGKTAVLISHRLSSVRMVDRILYLEGGEIKESGYHNELIGLNGEYAKLFNLQASMYKT
jgi:ATP-binding cassette, subfamily B, bacterial